MIYLVYDPRWRALLPVEPEQFPVYLRFCAAFLGLRSYVVLLYDGKEVKEAAVEEVRPGREEVYLAEPGDAARAAPLIEGWDYIVVRPEDHVLRAWRALLAIAPLIRGGRVERMESISGVLVGKSPLGPGRFEVEAVVEVLNVKPVERRKRALVACPTCGREGRLLVELKVLHEEKGSLRACAVARGHPARKAATAAAVTALSASAAAGGGGGAPPPGG